MMNFDIKRKINNLRDILVGKVPDPKAQVEQITIALIYKFMDDMDLQGVEFGGSRVFFKDEYEKYAFSQIMLTEHSAQDKLNLYAEGMDKMVENPELPKLFRDILRNTYIPYRDPETLNRFLKEIAEFSYDDSEDLGNAFEYLLSIMGSQGDAGQFRTPRHIIDMMVEIVAPQKNETILDPSCGTAGFLISAYNYIKKHNLDKNGNSTLTPDDKNRMTENFEGYDISPDMVRLARVNMYLHGFTTPKIHEYDTLTSLDRWDDNFDVVLANPPFMTPKGGITPHTRYRVDAKRAEVLFVDYIAEHLNPTGRAAIIVPEGVVFQSQTAYKNLRRMLVDEGYLYGVISLPSGVFNPYSGVKTSILLIDKTLAKTKDSILFVKLNNDGYDLGAQRREIKGSEIPDIINIFKDYQNGKDVSDQKNVVFASKSEIAKQEHILVGERYKTATIVSSRWSMVKLGDITEVVSGNGFPKDLQGDENGVIPFYKVSDMNLTGNESSMFTSNNYVARQVLHEQNWRLVSSNTVIFPKIGAAIATNKKRMLTTESLFDNNVMGLVCSDQVDKRYLYYILQSIDLRLWASESNPPSIRKTTVEQFAIPLPPISIQQEIVLEIEQYQKIIDAARQIEDNYKPTIKINPQWETAKVGEVVDFISGVTLSVGECLDEEGLPLITIADVGEDGKIYTDEIRSVSTNKKVNKLRKGDLLFNWRNGSKNLVGKTALFNLDGDYIFASFLLGLRPHSSIDSKFLWVLLNQYRIEGKYMQFMRQNVNGLFNRDELQEVIIPVPAIEIQKEIVSAIEEEMGIVKYNKRLVEIFEKKIQDKLSEVWGE